MDVVIFIFGFEWQGKALGAQLGARSKDRRKRIYKDEIATCPERSIKAKVQQLSSISKAFKARTLCFSPLSIIPPQVQPSNPFTPLQTQATMLCTSLLAVGLTALHLAPQVLTSTVPSFSSLERRAEIDSIVPFPFGDDADLGDLVKVFGIITDMPDSVIDKGDAAIKKWVQSQTNIAARSNDISARDAEADPEAALEPRQGFLQVALCAAAILRAVAENAVPVAKVRALIRAIGGVRKLARALLRARSFAELITIAGPEAGELVQIFFGVTGVVNSCFGF